MWIASMAGNPFYSNVMIRMMLFIALLIPSLRFHAGEGDRVISGRVVDHKSGEGIPGVTIYSIDGRSCTGSNEDGEYTLAVSCNTGDTVVFSAFGYLRDTIACAKLSRQPTVKLKSGGLELKEVSIEAMTPHYLLDEVLRRIPENYRVDTTCNRYFSRYCYVANDSVYLFYENVLESVRTGYGKLDGKRRINYDDTRKRQLGNYNTVLQSRLLICDSVFLYKLIRNRYRVREMLSYNDNNAIADPVEAPNAHVMLAKRLRKKFKMTLSEIDDSLGSGHYKLTMKGMDQTIGLVINPADYAITSITIEQDTGTTIFPAGKTYRERHPLAKQTCRQRRTEYRYDIVNGKYTLVSYSFHNIYTDVCHNEYRWKDAPTVQEFQSTGIVQLIGQIPAHDLQEDIFRTEVQKTAFDQISTKYSHYDDTFWQGISYPPIPKGMENALNATLQRLVGQ